MSGKYKPLCKKHPTYLATRKPRAQCEACWRAWWKRHPEKFVPAWKEARGFVDYLLSRN